jgi:glycosyltransferase involved in cell wall biosynthesis
MRAVARYLPDFGWRSVVVTCRPGAETVQDSALLKGLPDDIVVYRTICPALLETLSGVWRRTKSVIQRRPRSCSHSSAAKDSQVAKPSNGSNVPVRSIGDWATWWFQVPDLKVGWVPWGVRAGIQAARRHRCKALYSSAPEFTSHLVALLTKRLTGLPWIADFRDPWRASPFRHLPYRSVDQFDAWLERCVIHAADRVVCNTEPVRQDFARRYSAMAHKFVTIPNGFDPDEFADIVPRRTVDASKTVLTHAGCFYGKRRPDAIFQSLAQFERQGLPKHDVVLQLLGAEYCDGVPLKEIAAKYGVTDRVRIMGEVPHRHALEYSRGSDIQLLVGFSGPGSDLQIPGKLFEYMGVGQPILALAPPHSAIAAAMNSVKGLGEVCNPDDPSAIAAAIKRLTDRYKCESGLRPETGEPLNQYHRRTQVERMAQLLDSIANRQQFRPGVRRRLSIGKD